MSVKAISLHNITTKINNYLIHDHLNLDVYSGETLGIVGKSGAGKSVLLQTILGLNKPVSGQIKIYDKDIYKLTLKQYNKHLENVGVLFQEGALFRSLNVLENIALPLKEHTDFSQKMINELAYLKMQMVGLSPETATKFPSELSGGMKKRAGLARALALDPGILFLDEPTAGLDPISALDFEELIIQLRESFHLTILMVTHDMEALLKLSSRIAALVDQKIIVGSFDELSTHENAWIREYFGSAKKMSVMRR